jgi:hypothetical protein
MKLSRRVSSWKSVAAAAAAAAAAAGGSTSPRHYFISDENTRQVLSRRATKSGDAHALYLALAVRWR